MEEPTSQYFEGILQLRNHNDNILLDIDQRVEKVSSKGIIISQIKKVRGGVDLYFNNNKYIQKLGRDLQKKFGGILKISPKLFSRDNQTGKDLFRVNVLLRLNDFVVGNILKIDNKYIKITSLDKRINGTDLELNKKKSFDYTDNYEILKIHKTTVCRIKPTIEVLHPETYQGVIVENKIKVKNGEKVKVIIDKNKVFIVGCAGWL